MTWIGQDAFYGCYNLKKIELLATTPPEAYTSTFDNSSYSNATLYVPKGCYDTFYGKNPWKNFKTIIEM